MPAYLRKYGVGTSSGTHVGIPMPKAGSADFATGSDWTPATGDVKVSIDGGAQANIATLPSYSNGQWVFAFSAGELTGKSIRVAIVDAATKAVDDNFFTVETFGNASALFAVDFSDAVRFGLTAIPNVAIGGDGAVMTQGATQQPTFKSLNIVNNSGDALSISSTGSNGHGANVSGNGSGMGLRVVGGATGYGMYCLGGATSGYGLVANAQSGNFAGAYFQGNGSGSGLNVIGGLTGRGVWVNGGSTSGIGVHVTTAGGATDYEVDADIHGTIKLAADGLDSISIVAPSGPASNFREMLVQLWRRFFKRATRDLVTGELKTYANDDTTVVTTQSVVASTASEVQGAAL